MFAEFFFFVGMDTAWKCLEIHSTREKVEVDEAGSFKGRML
jgi:hypothetical protein